MAYNSEKNNLESIMRIAQELTDQDATFKGFGEEIGIMAGFVLIACRIDDLIDQIEKSV